MENSERIYSISLIVDHEQSRECRHARGLRAAAEIASEMIATAFPFGFGPEYNTYNPEEFSVVVRELEIEER